MKNLFAAAFIVLTIAACSKKSTDAVTPDAVSVVSGTYVMNYFRQDSAGVKDEINLPYVVNGQTVISGTVTVSKGTATNTVHLAAHLVISGSPDSNGDFGDFTLQQAGSSYDLYDGTTKFGTLDGTNLTYDETYTGTDKITYRTIINAVKQK